MMGYWASGGSILDATGREIPYDDARTLVDVWTCEAGRCQRYGWMTLAHMFADLAADMARAINGVNEWRRCAGGTK